MRLRTVFNLPRLNLSGLRFSLGLGLVGLLLAGCTSEPAAPAPQAGSSPQATAPSTTGGSAPKTSEIKLAPAGEPTPPLDGGRLQATMPQGWKFLPRSSDYLFAAYHEDKTGVPRIILTQDEADDLPATISADTAQKLAAKISAEAGDGADAAITTVNVGDNWFVRYEKAKRFRSQSARGVTLETVNRDKRYRIELLTYTEMKDEFLPALYRFAASLEFQDGEDEKAPAEEPASDEEMPEKNVPEVSDEAPAETALEGSDGEDSAPAADDDAS